MYGAAKNATAPAPKASAGTAMKVQAVGAILTATVHFATDDFQATIGLADCLIAKVEQVGRAEQGKLATSPAAKMSGASVRSNMSTTIPPLTSSVGGASLNIYTDVGLVTLMGLISKHAILIVGFANDAQRMLQQSPAKL